MGFFGKKEEPVEEEKKNENAYEYDDWACDNCGVDGGGFEIPEGTRVIDFLKDRKCEYCGCNISDEESRIKLRS